MPTAARPAPRSAARERLAEAITKHKLAVSRVRALEEAVYGWFAKNRSRFSRFGVRPECDEAGADCE